ncbi:MAG TPA: hypothetical protein VGM19_03535 [Armatimonadota bacterium]|jgi:hypothetical protein
MSERQPLMIADFAALRRKIASPPAGLGELLERFNTKLAADEDFRRSNLYLPALLGDSAAREQARTQILAGAADYGSRPDNDYQFDVHTWCSAAPGMRWAIYFDWLDCAGVWTEAERIAVAEGLLHFGYTHCVNTLRSRFPMADNQSLSMSLYSAVIGHVFSTCAPVAERAAALRDYGLSQMEIRLGVAPPEGYMGEGSTYQSLVVAPVTMWIGAFLSSLQGPGVLTRRWAPMNATLLDVLKVESLLADPGQLLPPWDHYGWQRQSNLAALTYYASATGQPELLAGAGTIWDRKDFIAWVSDDRMWALTYWPEQPVVAPARPVLSGWSLPGTAAAIDHAPGASRLMLAWDRCCFDRQGLARQQVNPNHLMYSQGGEPIFGDGVTGDGTPFLPVTTEEIVAPLDAEERELITAQYGSLERWATGQQPGLIGAANTVLLDGEWGYFPPGARRGQLVAESRESGLHVVTAESLDYYQPRYDLTRARRTVAVSASGLAWIVDDYCAASAHRFTWQTYLRRGCRLEGDGLTLTTSGGQQLRLAWTEGVTASLTEVANFPVQDQGIEGRCWPEAGSQRLLLEETGDRAKFVVCLLPGGSDDLRVETVGPNHWRATWVGGSEEFRLPASADAPVAPLPYPLEGLCDLDAEPFDLLDEPTEALLAALVAPDKDAWRHTVRAMQTLTMRGVAEAFPLIEKLLRDAEQRYQTQAVAAWCLGHARYRAALPSLQRAARAPETNIGFRSRCALEAME